MKSLKSFVPNAISFLNLNAGVVAIIAALDHRLVLAVGFILVGIFFDFFDGMAARVLNAKSELGVQMDSFADLITSGLAPGILLMQLMSIAFLGDQHSLLEALIEQPLILFGLFVPMGSAYRLGVFNLDDSQSDSFVGLPTPANAILIASLILIAHYQPYSFIMPIIEQPYVLIGLSILSAFLLNAPIRLFSFKLKSLSFKENIRQIVFVVLSVFLLILLTWTAIPLVIVLYLIFGKWERFKN